MSRLPGRLFLWEIDNAQTLIPDTGEDQIVAGSISLSLSQQFDSLGKPLNGGKIYFIQAGTTSTPQNAFQDSALTIPWPNPLTLDSAGRVPQLFFADGNIKVRIVNSVGITQVVADNILVVGPSSGGGGGSVDPTTVMSTGDLKVRYGTGALSGFVRGNGRTIGSATSGATERANADTQALFEFLYVTDVNLAVSGGRGASAAADWAANKTIALPDYRGRALAGLDDMGNSAAGRLTAAYFGTAATVLGAAGGEEKRTLTLAQLPTGITSANAAQAITVASAYNYPDSGAYVENSTLPGGADIYWRPNSYVGVARISSSGTNAISVTSSNTNGSAHATASPMMLATVYLKL